MFGFSGMLAAHPARSRVHYPLGGAGRACAAIGIRNCMNADTRFFFPPRGRFAPSPTGRLHLGNAFAFLMAWLSMRRQGGRMILRIEDIDPVRSRPEFVRGIMEDLTWLGLDWDEGPPDDNEATGRSAFTREGRDSRRSRGLFGPYIQSQRSRRYEDIIAGLQERGLVYPCYCTRKELRMLASAPHVGDEGAPYPGTCREFTDNQRKKMKQNGRRFCLRLNTEAAVRRLTACSGAPFALRFTDGVLGEQCFSMRDCGGDFALRRSDGVFAYQLAVTADDADMGVTEVVRGEDLLLSTPRQLLLFQLLGKTPPKYAHVPLLHDAAGERLAKRHKSLELAALRLAGLRPQDVLSRLGGLAGCLDHPAGPAEKREALLARMAAGFSLHKLEGRRLSVDTAVTDW